jgi:zeaxanthin glucosyltransferase
VIYGIADCEARVRAAGVEFYRIGAEDYPPGTLSQLDERLGELKGLATFKFTVERVKNTARMMLRDGPDAVRRTNVEAILVDEADMGGDSARKLQAAFQQVDGLNRAADIIEQVFGIGAHRTGVWMDSVAAD